MAKTKPAERPPKKKETLVDWRKSAEAAKLTKHRRQCYDLCARIPRGRVSTYGVIAKLIGGSCARAVGNAMKRNPFAPRVPCHRVIASSRELGGFNGTWGSKSIEVQRKYKMLVKEGVHFENKVGVKGPKVSPEYVLNEKSSVWKSK